MKKKILLIEDNLEMRENIGEILELSNYEVITAENGKVGVDSAKKSEPDLIICDIMMPELDGYGVLYLLSRDPATAGIPFIFLTAKGEKSDMRKGMELGADDYITKPFEEMDLLNAIESRLKKSEILRKEFPKGESGVDEFMDDVRSFDELKDLQQERKRRKYRKKDIIYYEGDMPNSLLLVASGKVKTWKMSDDGKELITDIYKEGDFFGYIPLLESGAYGESATALEDTEITFIPKDEFKKLMEKNRDVSIRFIRMLANNIRDNEERLLRMAYSSVRERVAEALLQLKKRYQESEGDQFNMQISRDDLASIVGTATESLIRTLSDFKDEKLIELNGREIKVTDSPGLQKVSRFYHSSGI